MRSRRHRILVMHGDEEIRRLIAACLTLEGFDVTTAASGQDCLYKALVTVPDILVTANVNSPGPPACGTATMLRGYLANSRVKVLLVSPAPVPDEEPGAGTRVDACLSAPFDPAEMIRTVRRLAGTSQRGPLSVCP